MLYFIKDGIIKELDRITDLKRNIWIKSVKWV